jgi:hypothetical protein
MGTPLTTFIMDLTKYPNVQDKMDNYIQPWDHDGNLIDWESYGTGWEGKKVDGVLTIEDTTDGFLEKMEWLLETLRAEVAYVNQTMEIDGAGDAQELDALATDIIDLSNSSRRGYRILCNNGR